METTLNRPAHKGYPGKVYIANLGDWGVCDPAYSPPTKREEELAEQIYNWYSKPFDDSNSEEK